MTRRPAATVAACGLLAVLALVTAPASVAAGVRSARDLARIDRFLTHGLHETGLPGMAVAITRDSHVVQTKGFGSAGGGRSVTSQTQFRLASLSKSFTAVAVLQLVEAGRVELDSPVRTYLPDFATADRTASGRITVRNLLNQTSGMADAGYRAVARKQPANPRQRVAGLHAADLVSEPGHEFNYFDPNYQVLARLVEVVTSTGFSAYMHEHVFAPLGMTDTVAVDSAADAPRAAPHLATGHVLVLGKAVARPELDGLLAGSGGVVSTAHDMARWLTMQTTGVAPGGRRLLSRSDIELMHTPPTGVAGGYGMGWQAPPPQPGPRRIEHNGVLSTFYTDQVLLPRTGYAFTLLYDGYSALADTADVANGLAAMLADGSAPGSVRDTRVVAVMVGCLTLGVVGLRVAHLIRRRRWAARRRARRWWLFVPGVAWMLLPGGVLFAMPALLLASIGRSFTLWQVCLAMPDVMVFLAAAAIAGVAVATARLFVLTRGPRG